MSIGWLETIVLSPILLQVVANREQLVANYPCLAAVDRCASHLKRHSARMILLEYNEGASEEVITSVSRLSPNRSPTLGINMLRN